MPDRCHTRSALLIGPTVLTLLLGLAAVSAHPARAAAHRAQVTPRPTPVPTAAGPQPASAYPKPARAKRSPKSYALTFAGAPVDFNLTGLEPDFDPIYKVTVSTKLHDLRPKGLALPDATLILSAYLEVFQPDTTPVLPDLLHPNQQAYDLAGFLSGAAVVVNAGGHVVYRGSLLAEVFQNSTEHLIVDLDPLNGSTGLGSVRLQGPLVLHKGGKETGKVEALQPFARIALAVSRGHLPTWQAVLDGLTVHKPAMMGTAGTPGKTAPAQPATIAPLASAKPAPTTCAIACRLGAARRPMVVGPLAIGAVILFLGVVLIRRRSRVRPPAIPGE
ncbi:MAG: hypothetical protein ACRDG4_00035 [Chloroflexota bacterium]